MADTIVSPTGVSATASEGSVSVFVWDEVDTSQTPSWSEISTLQTPNWTEVSTSQTPTWIEIAA